MITITTTVHSTIHTGPHIYVLHSHVRAQHSMERYVTVENSV